MDTITIDKRLIPFLLQLPARQVWMDYDAEGDVLYLSFAMPQQATDSVMGEDGNVYHYRDDYLAGVTSFHASTRAQATGESEHNFLLYLVHKVKLLGQCAGALHSL